MKTSDLLVKALENEGVEYIFGIPGEENLDFLDSLKHSSIRLIITRHEQGAGFMAANYGRLTGKPGCVYQHSALEQPIWSRLPLMRNLAVCRC